MILTKSLRVDYQGVNAVDDLSLTVEAGQIYGLVGPNGAGKTSTIKALAGIIEPTYGEIKIDNIDLEIHPQQALQQIGYMPDFPPVYERLKVWEYLDVFAAAYCVPRNERFKKIKHWVEVVQLSDKWDAMIQDLSRGMRQRLVLAKTLLHEPKVLLLDEPASGLDPIARRQMSDILKGVANKDRTILISSHILTELSDFCNAVGIMEKGKLVVSGGIEEIRSHIEAKGQLIIKVTEANETVMHDLLKFLENSQHTGNIKSISSFEIHADFSGGPNDSAWILTQLIKHDIPISDFYVKEPDVEEIFFQIGVSQAS